MKKRPRKTRPPTKTLPRATEQIPQPRNLTPALCQRLQRDLNRACLEVAKAHGLAMEAGQVREVDLRFALTYSVRVGIAMDDGQIYSRDRALFESLAPAFGLAPSDFGRTFWTSGDLFRLVSINPNRPKYPISADRVRDGRRFKFTADGVLASLNEARSR